MQRGIANNAYPLSIPRPKPPTIVADQPFLARFISTSRLNGDPDELGTLSKSGEMFRNSNGDIRIEWFSEATVLLALIDKPSAILYLELRAWEPIDGGLRRFSTVSHWAYSSSVPVYSDTYKTIYGLRCRLVRLLDPLSKASAGEAWIAEDAGIPMCDTLHQAGSTLEWKITKLTWGEPDESLFNIPADYTELREP